MPKPIKQMRLITLLALGASLISGCSNSSDKTTAQEQTAAPVPTEQAAREDVTLRFAWWGSENRHKALLAAIDAYTAKNPHVQIEAEYSGFDGYYEKLVTQLAGGTAPDLTPLSFDWIDEIAVKGDLTIDWYEQKDNVNLDAFDSGFLEKYTVVNGKLVGLPMGINGMVTAYSKPFFDKYGIEESSDWDWEKIHETGVKVHEQDPEAYLLAQLDVRGFLQPYVAQLTGGQWINEDKTPGFTAGQLEQAFAYYKQLLDDGVLQPLAQSSLYPEITENPAWQQGKIGAVFGLASTLSKLKSFNPDIDVASYPVPADAKASGVVVNPSNPLALNRASKHPGEAAKFASWLLTDPEAAEILMDVYSVPPVKANADLLAGKGLIDSTVVKAVELALTNPGDPVNGISGNQELSKLAEDYLQQVGFGQLEPRAAAEGLITRLNDKLKDIE
ncbi:ABC transporter substrate-binding protein [Paenibacillus sp. S150]|uniref:ABC transporter substrate-binding protein n=1 Tax=Paenibacillus sp. S150 TaxID=2749826 RepID=UPI001C5A1CBA|nr:extracellular solute-binding protein [Paenibacillus sp. S150]MBW4082541.1 extracellular solute-binding protein [Paenibacillus sp. S150]